MEYIIMLLILVCLSYIFCSAEQTLLFAIIIVSLISVIGYGNNIIRLTEYDFKEPYKAEALRGLGVVIPPVGIVMGYITIEDRVEEPTENQ